MAKRRRYDKARFVKIREVLGTEVYRDRKTGREFYFDFNKNKEITIKPGKKGRRRKR